MVTVTKIDKDEIPEVSNKYLMRGERDETKDQKNRERRDKNSADRDRRYVHLAILFAFFYVIGFP